jgi:hypothetical protein
MLSEKKSILNYFSKILNNNGALLTFLTLVVSASISGALFYNSSSFFIYIFPGLLFGIFFSMVNIEKVEYKLIFTILSIFIYGTAVKLNYTLIDDVDIPSYNSFVKSYSDANFLISLIGFIPGSFGAFTLYIITIIIEKIKFNLRTTFLLLFIGGFCGSIFNLILFFPNSLMAISHPIICFAIWQLPIGVLLSLEIKRSIDYDIIKDKVEKICLRFNIAFIIISFLYFLPALTNELLMSVRPNVIVIPILSTIVLPFFIVIEMLLRRYNKSRYALLSFPFIEGKNRISITFNGIITLMCIIVILMFFKLLIKSLINNLFYDFAIIKISIIFIINFLNLIVLTRFMSIKRI